LRDKTIRNYPQSILRWAANKRRLILALSSLNPTEFKRYVEPFAGSTCPFFNSSPDDALPGDINEELINTRRQIKARSNRPTEALERILDGSLKIFYQLRAANPAKHNVIDRAARFIYLNRLCFPGTDRRLS
jgi:DNA adenine methylase